MKNISWIDLHLLFLKVVISIKDNFWFCLTHLNAYWLSKSEILLYEEGEVKSFTKSLNWKVLFNLEKLYESKREQTAFKTFLDCVAFGHLVIFAYHFKFFHLILSFMLTSWKISEKQDFKKWKNIFYVHRSLQFYNLLTTFLIFSTTSSLVSSASTSIVIQKGSSHIWSGASIRFSNT